MMTMFENCKSRLSLVVLTAKLAPTAQRIIDRVGW